MQFLKACAISWSLVYYELLTWHKMNSGKFLGSYPPRPSPHPPSSLLSHPTIPPSITPFNQPSLLPSHFNKDINHFNLWCVTKLIPRTITHTHTRTHTHTHTHIHTHRPHCYATVTNLNVITTFLILPFQYTRLINASSCNMITC